MNFGRVVGLCDCSGDGSPEVVIGDQFTNPGRAFLFQGTASGLATTSSLKRVLRLGDLSVSRGPAQPANV